MKDKSTRSIILAKRPNGNATLDDFKFVEQPLPTLKDGEVLLRNVLISMDPYQRNLMGNAGSELPPIDVGQPMPGPTIAVIEESRNPKFAAGDHVISWSGWQESAVSEGGELQKVDTIAAPLSASLGVLGHTGHTAWVGINKYMKPKSGGTLVVTAAAGAVGSVAAQLGRLKGFRVVGIAGGPEKVKYLLDELGLDAAVDYKAADFKEQLGLALPNGIDAVFENVGAPMFEALMGYFNMHAQVVVCGSIAHYSSPEVSSGPDHLPELLKLFLYRFIQVHGFSILDHLSSRNDFVAEVAPLVSQGKVSYREQLVEGFDNIPSAFLGLFEGNNHGKLIAMIG